MEHLAGRLSVKRDPFVRHEETPVVSGVDRLRGYYDEARNRLRQYLGRDDAMGSGSSTPRTLDMGGGDGEGGVVFEQRPAHCRLEGKTEESSEEEFTDISYSDLGFIITPKTKKLTVNNNYNMDEDGQPTQLTTTLSPTPTLTTAGYLDQDCDFVSSNVESGHSRAPCSSSSSSSSSSSNSSMASVTLHHRGSTGSFTVSQLPGTAAQRAPSLTNLGDLRLEEITT